MTYQDYRNQIAQLQSDLAMSDRARSRKDEQIAAVVATCQRHCHPGCNTGAHALAAKVLSLLGQAVVEDVA